MAKLVIFGAGEIAQLAWHYFSTDSDFEVVGFTVDRDYVTTDSLFGLPVVAFEQVADRFPTEDHSIFVALSYSNLNALRREKYHAAKQMGYPVASYVSSRATFLSDEIVGENCFILEDNTIQPFAVIGNNVTLWSGNHIGHHSVIKDHCFLASHIVVSGGVEIGESCFIGVNATLRDHIKIGEKCVIGAGALLLSDVAPQGVYLGQESERSRVPSTRLRNI
jgi:sugar O-acyltransferase (sialic acid O-acetyltransferase NeuD family)